MRLSHQKQYDIKETILKHLYDASKQRLDDKKGALVLRNHSEWIKPYMTIINQLPDYLLNTAESIQMEIPELSDMGLDDAGYQKKAHKTTWTQFVDAGLPIMRKGSGWNAKEIPIPLQDGMREEVIALRTEDFELSQEKRAMEKYLDTTMEINNTTSKLRKVFPSTLQKYIPPEPPRAPRQPKLNLDTPEQPDVPGNLKKRLTENLLNN